MMTPQTIQGYVKAEPYRPFRVHLVSGRTLEVRHPELIKVLKSTLIVFKSSSESLVLIESHSQLEQTVS